MHWNSSYDVMINIGGGNFWLLYTRCGKINYHCLFPFTQDYKYSKIKAQIRQIDNFKYV